MPIHVCNGATLKCGFVHVAGQSRFRRRDGGGVWDPDAGALHSGDPRALVTGAISDPVILDSAPALDNVSTLQCTLGGTITILYPGETTEMIP